METFQDSVLNLYHEEILNNQNVTYCMLFMCTSMSQCRTVHL